jgi:SAM-dependent methyltransferase
MNLPFHFQSHEANAGLTDSQYKWDRLQVPGSLVGKSALDIGCNEGRMTSWLAERGAVRVVGVDSDGVRIDFARNRYGSDKIQFLSQSWTELPDGPFDLVLWANAMHYEKNPKAVLSTILKRLSPDGLLIIECGYIVQPGRKMVSIARHLDTNVAQYPTYEYLTEVLLRDFSIQQVAGPEPASIRRESDGELALVREATGLEISPGEADPVPRGVFHCRPRAPEVMFVTGGGVSRSDLVRSVGRAADKVISVHDRINRTVVKQYAPALQEENFVDWLSQLCAGSDGLVIIEGDVTEDAIKLFVKNNPHRKVWVLREPGESCFV